MISLVQLLKEAQGAPKAVILAGAPGAGKSSVVGDTLSGLGLTVLNIDDDFIKNLKDAGVSLDLKKADQVHHDMLLMSSTIEENEELQTMGQRIQMFNQSAQQELQRKQMDLMLPISEKAQAAVEKVAAANGFTYILDASASKAAASILLTPFVKFHPVRVLSVYSHCTHHVLPRSK